jgi:hypothetical protein
MNFEIIPSDDVVCVRKDAIVTYAETRDILLNYTQDHDDAKVVEYNIIRNPQTPAIGADIRAAMAKLIIPLKF